MAPFSAAQAPKVVLTQKSFFDGQILIQLPDSFQPMKEEMLRLKYPSERRPTIVFSNDMGSVNIALNHTNNSVLPEEVPGLHKAMEGMFKNLYPSAEWYRSEVFDRDGRKYFMLDLQTPAIDTQIRNTIIGTSYKGKMLLISFNVTQELEKLWIGIGHQILNSVQIRDNH